MSSENLAIRSKYFELEINKKFLTVFLQNTFCFHELVMRTSQFFD